MMNLGTTKRLALVAMMTVGMSVSGAASTAQAAPAPKDGPPLGYLCKQDFGHTYVCSKIGNGTGTVLTCDATASGPWSCKPQDPQPPNKL